MTLESDLNDDEAARHLALDVNRSFIVQAPAGSGKTELLIQRYLKLLATVNHPEEVLAITFTRKAAAEMQLRVLQALQRASNGFEPGEMYERVTADAATAVLKRDEQLHWHLVENPRRMRIQTLDSLNASIARTQALTSTGGAAASAVAADATMRSLYRDAARLTLDQLPEQGPLSTATQDVLQHLDNNTGLYIAYLARMLATRDQWLPFIGSGLVDPEDEQALRLRFENNLEGTVGEHLARMRAAMPVVIGADVFKLAAFAAGNLIDAGKTTNPTCALALAAEVPAIDGESAALWQGLAETLLTKDGNWRKTVNKTQGFPAGTVERDTMLDVLQAVVDADEFRELLHDVRILPPVRYSDEQWYVLLALFRLLPLAVTELKRLFSDGGVIDYIEVALSAAAALGTADEPGDVALLLDYQLRHLLVDEMQDTSSAQYRMLEALTGGWQDGDGRTLFCVGDPMQSVYRFRNAEVGQFLLARQVGIGNVRLESLTLRRNFRSGEKLVEWFNDVFPGVLPARDDSRQSAVSYSAAVAVPKFAGEGRCVVHPLFGSSPTEEALAGCRVIHDTIAAHPDADMAVLVRSRTHLPRLLAQLRRSGIAYRAVEIDRLTDLPEIIDILALTRAIVHRSDRLAWLALLRSPWAGLDWSDLHTLVTGATKATAWELLQDEKRLAQLSVFGRDAALRLRAALAAELPGGRVDTLRDVLERLWIALGGPALLEDAHAVENVYRYLDVIESIEVAGTIPDIARLEEILDYEHVSSDSAARLQVMTMHRAKGLQFDHILLYGLGRSPGTHQRDVLSWFDIPGEHAGDEKVISPVGPRAEMQNDPLHRFIEKTEAAKNRHELGRLLYVACTRARKSLHLLGHVEYSRDGQDFSPPRADSLLRRLWPAVAQDFASAFTPRLPAVENDGGIGWLQPALKRFDAPWVAPQPAALPVETPLPDAEAESRAVEFYWVGSGARVAGTIVHRWLQHAADGQVDLAAEKTETLASTTERWLAEMGIAGESRYAITKRVLAALSGITSDARGRWLLAGDGEAELPLSGIHQGRIESVVLDRVRIDDDGTHWIVDYKTSSHEGGSLEHFLQAETDRYRSQLQKYAALYSVYSGAAVRCALYFPLLQEFIEVPAAGGA